MVDSCGPYLAEREVPFIPRGGGGALAACMGKP